MEPADKADLRRRSTRSPRRREMAYAEMGLEEVARLVRELELHESELELQNEELLRVQADLEAARDRYRDLFDFAPVGYLALSPAGEIKVANLTAASLLGLERSRLAGPRLAAFAVEEDAPVVHSHLHEVFAGVGRQVSEVRLRRDGEPRWIRLESTLKEREGEECHCRTVLSDVTAQRRAEDALRAAGRRKDELMVALAHELRNPLSPILTSAEMLHAGGADPAVVERARETIEKQVRLMAQLVDDVLDVARLGSETPALQRKRVSLSSLLEDALQAARPLVEGKQHELVVQRPEVDLYLDVDPARAAQVITNLLRHAAHRTTSGGRIELVASREDRTATIMVRDSGIGPAREELPRIFEAFIGIEAGAAAGLGVGLALAKRLVELHGGTIEARRGRGRNRGAELIVRLPLPSQRLRPRGERPPAEAQPSPGPWRILVVDDQPDVAESLGMLLSLLGHETRVAGSGEQALAEARSFRPEAVLLDIGMPGMDGYEVARRMRQRKSLEQVVLIALTGWGQPSDRAKAKAAGFDHHLTKPVDHTEIARVLHRSRRPDPGAAED